MKRIGIITALPREAKCLTGYEPQPDIPVEISDNIIMIVSGMGNERAKIAADKLVNNGVEGLISFGTAGALIDDINPGDLILPSSILTDSFASLPVTQNWHHRALAKLANIRGEIHTGPIITVAGMVTCAGEKTLLNQQSGAIAVDMESAAVIAVANKQHIDCLVIRAIVDTMEMIIPECISKHCDQYGKVRLLPLLLALLKHPGQIAALLRLNKGFRAAADNLSYAGSQLTQI